MSQNNYPYPFATAADLVGYTEEHSGTPRALIRFDQFVHLAYIAGWDISHVKRKDLEDKGYFISLHSYPHKIILDAQQRLQKGLVPENWMELFDATIDNKDPNIISFSNRKEK